MPLVDRNLLVDRPTVTDPVIGTDDDEGEAEEQEIEVFGDGGGKEVHGVEFEEGDEDIIKGANLVAMLATGSDEVDDVFQDIFVNTAVQLNHAKAAGEDSSELAAVAERLNAADLGGVEFEDEEETEEDVVIETEESDDVEEDEEVDTSEDSEDSDEDRGEDEEWFDEEDDEETSEE